jgi:hypothetical protein
MRQGDLELASFPPVFHLDVQLMTAICGPVTKQHAIVSHSSCGSFSARVVGLDH